MLNECLVLNMFWAVIGLIIPSQNIHPTVSYGTYSMNDFRIRVLCTAT